MKFLTNMKIHCIRHEPFEGLACILNWIEEHNHKLTFTHIHLGQSFPAEIDFDLLIVMGGTASLYDHKNSGWLKAQKNFIKRTLSADKKVIGICLGAQILAMVLGAEVYKNKQKEIGWYTTYFNDAAREALPFLPEKLESFHWHGDTFDIPDGATRIASSDVTPNQGFIYKNQILALQFHLELTEESLQKITRALKSELSKKQSTVQDSEQIMGRKELIASNNLLMYSILDFFAQ